MALTNAQKQARWRAKRNALAEEAVRLREEVARLRNRGPAPDTDVWLRNRASTPGPDTGELKQAKARIAELERQLKAKPEPQIDASTFTFSMTQVQKLEAWQRQRMREMQQKLDETIAAERKKVQDEHRRWAEDTFLPHVRKEQDQAQKVMNARRGIMKKDTFRLIWSCLHPDSRNSTTDKKLSAAFNAFEALEKYLLKEQDSPTTFSTLPRTMAEWDAMRAKATADRKAKRAGQPARK